MKEVYQVSPWISSETIDGEVMILDFETGHYYNLSQSGALVWEFLQAGARADEIVEGLLARFEGEPEKIGRSVEMLLTEFKQERLIAADPKVSVRADFQVAGTGPREPFTEPVFNKFTDLKELLLIDPIHDIDDAGWPRAKA